jgi:hypothetical protein
VGICVSWDRSAVATALVTALQTQVGETVFVFPKPPQTINPPAMIVGRPTEVRYSEIAFAIDLAQLPITCVGPADGEEMVDGLIGSVRDALPSGSNLGGLVQVVYADSERGWRNLNIAGVDLLLADVNLTIHM